jgi:hypothetical protein
VPEPLDPEVVATIRRITDRFVRLGKGTPLHEVRSSLGTKRHALVEAERHGFVRELSGNYLPRLRAEEFEDAPTRSYIRHCTTLVLRALQWLYRAEGARQYSGSEILSAATQQIDPTADADMVRTGLLFAVDFRRFWASWGSSGERLVGAIGVTDDILDFDSLDLAWEQELKSRHEEERSGIEQVSEPAVPLQPGAREEVGVARYGRWETVGKPLGRGGQGVVYLARDTSSLDLDNAAAAIVNTISIVGAAVKSATDRIQSAADLARRVLDFGKERDPAFCGALKVLHPADNEDEYKKQLRRMRNEIDALSKITHPNVARILEASLDEHWFVMEYFPEKTLADHQHRFKGDLFGALSAIRPLVEGVAEIHRTKLVHRDIKPENVFVSASRGLVLADFGLVFFTEDDRSRVSDIYDNVGSRDWMPGWAQGMRVEDIRPTFDVFSLGKLLWSMVSGKRKLRLWYHHEDEFELEKMFQGDADVCWARILLDKCIVEQEKDCRFPDAGALLTEVDRVLGALRRKGQVVSNTVTRICRVCGLGNYREVTGQRFQALSSPGGFRIFLCSHCGHTELFSQGEFPGPVTFRPT